VNDRLIGQVPAPYAHLQKQYTEYCKYDEIVKKMRKIKLSVHEKYMN